MKLREHMKAALVAASIAGMISGPALGQGFTIPNNTPFLGHYVAQGAIPVGVGCTIQASATDTDGSCTASAASGSITFGAAFANAPYCTLVDSSATPIAVYTVSNTAITLTTITSGHIYFWHCAAKAGG